MTNWTAHPSVHCSINSLYKYQLKCCLSLVCKHSVFVLVFLTPKLGQCWSVRCWWCFFFCSQMCLFSKRRRLQYLLWGCAVQRRREGKLQAERTVPVIWWKQSFSLEKASRLERTKLLVRPPTYISQPYRVILPKLEFYTAVILFFT